MSSIHHICGKNNNLVTYFHVWIVFEDFADPFGVESHIDEDGRTSGDGASASVDAYAHYDLAFSFLAHQRSAVVFL